jgi:hypothetical protein
MPGIPITPTARVLFFDTNDTDMLRSRLPITPVAPRRHPLREVRLRGQPRRPLAKADSASQTMLMRRKIALSPRNSAGSRGMAPCQGFFVPETPDVNFQDCAPSSVHCAPSSEPPSPPRFEQSQRHEAKRPKSIGAFTSPKKQRCTRACSRQTHGLLNAPKKPRGKEGFVQAVVYSFHNDPSLRNSQTVHEQGARLGEIIAAHGAVFRVCLGPSPTSMGSEAYHLAGGSMTEHRLRIALGRAMGDNL